MQIRRHLSDDLLSPPKQSQEPMKLHGWFESGWNRKAHFFYKRVGSDRVVAECGEWALEKNLKPRGDDSYAPCCKSCMHIVKEESRNPVSSD